MAIFGALSTARSGLIATGASLSVIGNNIANVNTVGFKGSRTEFADLLSAQGGTGKFADPAQATAELGKIPTEVFTANLKSGVGELARRVPDKKVAVVGFCMGGGLVWQLLGSGEPQLAAAVPFYGPAPDNPDFAGSKNVAVLAFYGALDQRVTSTQPIVKAALDKAGMVNHLVVEPDANHAFFNDTGDRYNATAANDAWRQVQDWFTKYVG